MNTTPTVRRALVAESFLLIPDTITDLADFTARPAHYLVGIDADPAAAAALWFARRERHPYGSEGLVRLRYHSLDLIPVDLWDDVTGIWLALLDAVEGYLRTGHGSGPLPEQPVELELQRLGRSARFTANGIRHVVDPDAVVPGILAEAHRYFSWVNDIIGEGQHQVFARLAELEPLAALALAGSVRSRPGATTGEKLRERVAAHGPDSRGGPIPGDHALDLQDLRARRSVAKVQGQNLSSAAD
ncbi:hypothetical protein [Paeniglutamicibacter cryotolerans]|uniref:Uncharacterized protein n=1 Tax=Paeniglutamicibacter cryotolerans TaxID=670079 RepID=A0A839QQC6_9MICC|nr:hypothetical protein [Paeniglutamicibacter cryotolerans]MBB2996835.1 hypothetical protein [Paeniglutamicibacter cryotolerans]